MAVGSAANGNYITPVAERWDGSAWTVTPAIPPTPAGTGELTGVSCPAWNFCMAVGDESGILALTEQWNGTRWTTEPGATGTAPDPVLAGVTCSSRTDCTAVGSTGAVDTAGRTLIEHWDGSVWAATAGPNMGLTVDDQLLSVSCPAPGACLAVGRAATMFDANTFPLAVGLSAGAWSVVTTGIPGPIIGMGSELRSVSCPAVTTCIAVGYRLSPSGDGPPLIEGGSMSGLTIQPTPGFSEGTMLGVSCSSAVSCTAVGGSATSGTVVATWDGTSWSLALTPTPAGGGAPVEHGIDCSARGDCLGVGDYGAGVPANFALILRFEAGGYWLVAGDGGIFSFGDTAFYGSTGGIALARPIVGMAATPDAYGYWLVAGDGGIFAFGDATFFGSTGGLPLASPIVGMAATPDGQGYWLVAADGGVFAYGDARFYGSLGGITLARPIVGMAATPDGQGYWLVAADGGVFAYGDAQFYGSTGGVALAQPIVGMATSADGLGYWLVAADGGVFAYGDAAFFGSTGGLTLARPIMGMAATVDGTGYWLVAADGGIFAFGAPFFGSTGGLTLVRPIVGMAPG